MIKTEINIIHSWGLYPFKTIQMKNDYLIMIQWNFLFNKCTEDFQIYFSRSTEWLSDKVYKRKCFSTLNTFLRAFKWWIKKVITLLENTDQKILRIWTLFTQWYLSHLQFGYCSFVSRYCVRAATKKKKEIDKSAVWKIMPFQKIIKKAIFYYVPWHTCC